MCTLLNEARERINDDKNNGNEKERLKESAKNDMNGRIA